MQKNTIVKYQKSCTSNFQNIEHWPLMGVMIFLVYWFYCMPIYFFSQLISVWFTNKLDILSLWMFYLTIAWVTLVNLRYISFYYYWVILKLNKEDTFFN